MKRFEITYTNKRGESVTSTHRASDAASALGLLQDSVDDIARGSEFRVREARRQRAPAPITEVAGMKEDMTANERLRAMVRPELPDGVVEAYGRGLQEAKS